MTYRNLIKNKIQYVFGAFFDKLSIERKLTDAQMECMQFGICDLGLYEMLLKLVLSIDLVILLIDSCKFKRYIK